MSYDGEKFLSKLYTDMHMKDSVVHSSNVSDKKLEKIRKYLDREERVHNKALQKGKLSLLKQAYYDKYVIKEIPDSYIEFLDKNNFDRTGYHLSEEEKAEQKRVIVEDQKKSLDRWLDYLTSEGAKFYPWWAKYWAFHGMLKVGAYDNSNNIYGTRDNKTVAPFIELNCEALSKTIDLVLKEVNKEEIEEENLKKLVSSGSFTKVYTVFLKDKKNVLHDKNNIDGKWVKYEQGNNYQSLHKSLCGYNTGWCTVGEETCKRQVKNGDFYVYYTMDENGEYKIPRIAIRMNGKCEIGEIKGISQGQNIEYVLEDILDKKLEEFSNIDIYRKKLVDSKLIADICRKVEINQELTREELSFIYEVDGEIERFGFGKDPRLVQIKSNRNMKKDFAKIFQCNEDEISFDEKEIYNEKYIKYFIGDLNLGSLFEVDNLVLPENIIGELNLRNLVKFDNLVLPKHVSVLYLNSLESANNLVLPEAKSIYLNNIKSAEGITFPKSLSYLNLSGLTTMEGLNLPDEVDFLILPFEMKQEHKDDNKTR